MDKSQGKMTDTKVEKEMKEINVGLHPVFYI